MSTPKTSDTAFFGHPRGLATLFFTEMWERFSYYGMRALLILFMTAAPATGGLGFDVAMAGAVYGIYTSSVYLMSLPGGWIADRFLGLRRAILVGGVLIAAGQFLLTIPGLAPFYGGLFIIVLGTGMLKPNVSTIVGKLYGENDVRRDSGFTIFYLGINLGAMIAPIVCGYLGQRVNWHYGFAAAGVGMVIGTIQFALGTKHLGDAGAKPVEAKNEKEHGQQRLLLVCFGALLALGCIAVVTLDVSPKTVADILGVVLIAVFFVVFGFLLTTGDWTPVERKRIVVIGILVLAAALFWSSFEQAGSTMTLFADKSTDNRVLGIAFPSSFYQSLNSAFLLAIGPLIAALWIWLGSRNPSPPFKFAFGLIFVGAGFFWLALGAAQSTEAAAGGALVSPMWLSGAYLLHTVGELVLSPVGLSTMTKLAPVRIAGFMMGVWFLSNAMGNYLGGRLAAFYESMPLTTLFGSVGAFGVGAGILMLLFSKPITKLMGGVR